MSATDLKPCPFCGHAPVLETVTRETTKLRAFTIRCTNGACQVRPQVGPIWNMQSSVSAIWDHRRRTPKR